MMIMGCPRKASKVRGGGGGLSSADILRSRGRRFFRCGRSQFLVQRTLTFRNLWCVRKDRGGLSQCWYVNGRIFRDIVRASFWTASYLITN